LGVNGKGKDSEPIEADGDMGGVPAQAEELSAAVDRAAASKLPRSGMLPVFSLMVSNGTGDFFRAGGF
jgi:hypothetical protein